MKEFEKYSLKKYHEELTKLRNFISDVSVNQSFKKWKKKFTIPETPQVLKKKNKRKKLEVNEWCTYFRKCSNTSKDVLKNIHTTKISFDSSEMQEIWIFQPAALNFPKSFLYHSESSHDYEDL